MLITINGPYKPLNNRMVYKVRDNISRLCSYSELELVQAETDFLVTEYFEKHFNNASSNQFGRISTSLAQMIARINAIYEDEHHKTINLRMICNDPKKLVIFGNYYVAKKLEVIADLKIKQQDDEETWAAKHVRNPDEDINLDEITTDTHVMKSQITEFANTMITHLNFPIPELNIVYMPNVHEFKKHMRDHMISKYEQKRLCLLYETYIEEISKRSKQSQFMMHNECFDPIVVYNLDNLKLGDYYITPEDKSSFVYCNTETQVVDRISEIIMSYLQHKNTSEDNTESLKSSKEEQA